MDTKCNDKGGKYAPYVEKAVSEATKSTMMHKHGCVIITKGGEVVTGRNRETSQTRRFKRRCTRHAEVDAGIKVKRSDLKDAVVIVVRVTGKTSGLAMSEPCPRCRRFLEKAGVRLVLFSV